MANDLEDGNRWQVVPRAFNGGRTLTAPEVPVTTKCFDLRVPRLCVCVCGWNSFASLKDKFVLSLGWPTCDCAPTSENTNIHVNIHHFVRKQTWYWVWFGDTCREVCFPSACSAEP